MDAALDLVSQIGQATAVPLILDSGTALGLFRDRQLLPQDRDVDVAVFQQHASAVFAYLDQEHPWQSHWQLQYWRYQQQVYKVLLLPRKRGSEQPRTVEIKIFRPWQDVWECPSVTRRQNLPKAAVPGPKVKNQVRQRQRHLPGLMRLKQVIAAQDAALPPWNWMLQANTWVVPRVFFQDLVPLAAVPGCVLPAACPDYLGFRYGAWQVPVTTWDYRHEDGAYCHRPPQAW